MNKSKLFLALLFSFLVSCANPTNPSNENTGDGTGIGGSTGGGNGSDFLDITTIAPDQEFEYSKTIFRSSSISTYRNPAIISADNGNIIAFAEVSKGGYALGEANAQVDVVYTVSKDGGNTWSDITYILPISKGPGISTTDNKGSPVVFKAQDGTLIVLATSGRVKVSVTATADEIAESPTRILISKSTDNGITWSNWEEINDSFWSTGVYTSGSGGGRPWVKYAIVTGKGVTLNNGTLVAAVFGSYNDSLGNARAEAHHAMYSEDNGNTWKASVGQVMSSDGNGQYKEPNILGPVGNGNQFLVTARNTDLANGRLYSRSTDDIGSAFTGNTANNNKYKRWNPALPDKNANSQGVKWNSTVYAHLSVDGTSDNTGLSIYISRDDAASFTKQYTILSETTPTGETSAIDVHSDGTLIILNSEVGSIGYNNIVFRRYSMKTITGENYTE